MASISTNQKQGSGAYNVVRDALQEMVINDAVTESKANKIAQRQAAQDRREQNSRSNQNLKDKYVNEEARGEGEENSDSDTDDEDRMLLDDDTALAEIRKKRIAQLKKKAVAQQTLVAEGRIEYRQIKEDEFLNEVKSGKVLCLFYKDEFETCKRIDSHMRFLSPLHHECKFIKIDAEKAPFFVSKLNVRVLPTIVFFAEGITNPAMCLMGFEGVENGELCSTRDLEEALVSFGFLLEAVVTEDDGPETMREGREDDKTNITYNANRERGAGKDQRSGNIYGFGRTSD
jgi:hypothetical protein|tara:strand:- start:928 stop:1791 length:864 start_codon:yes stop_codon:yes gene_type:complete